MPNEKLNLDILFNERAASADLDKIIKKLEQKKVLLSAELKPIEDSSMKKFSASLKQTQKETGGLKDAMDSLFEAISQVGSAKELFQSFGEIGKWNHRFCPAWV